MVGVDASRTMVAAAREADPAFDVRLADAGELPFEDGDFDLVVAFMSLQDVDELELAVASRPGCSSRTAACALRSSIR